MLRRAVFPLLAVLALAGCATSSNTLDVTPTMTLPQQDPALMGVTISINGADQRTSQALAQVTRDNQLVTLTPSRDLRFLLQEVLEKQMTARGYMIGPDGAVDLQIVVNKLYANVSQGNLRYSITTSADISITATAKNGNKQIKTYRQTYSIEGPFSATNDKITQAVNQTLSDVITDMSRDTSINQFIKQNSH
ncbi:MULTISPECIES: lipoprotein [Tatumella]|uniref:Lipoprotein n=1 Tax=Tatumella punctata TaxID=399969 RepID=A0ABW1VNZ2_9GAMM|nr:MULTISPECIES: lipoprotein [unclassified Tatumella]MBS0854478.1 lipoprotein [Tatumella sp. JGM16]MBS0875767.1 lipoprotein [Tatumella sp. JGM82]MBS0890172.1 lipoprotein [Tatumella sp. JGM94]MBS0893752.1 lipoprotein [Tatumella sp. JGM130]MBS0900298.1 lipoprotein [Tatumella sp. JGM100]